MPFDVGIHELVKHYVRGTGVLVISNELVVVLGYLPGCYSDRTPPGLVTM